MQYIHELPLYSKRHYCSFEATHQRTLVREFFLRVPLLSKGKMLYVTNCTVLLHQCNHGKKYYNQNIENIVTFSSFTQCLKITSKSHFSQHYERSELFNENIFQMKGEVLNETFLMIFTHCASKLLANYDRLTFSNKIWGPYFRIWNLRVWKK